MDDFDSEDKRLRSRLKESAIVLAEEINEYCQAFRNHCRNGLVLGYQDFLAKLYYDIAYANYKYYRTDFIRNNLSDVRKYLQKSIEQFSTEEEIVENVRIVKQAKYFLDSVCDLYFISKIDLTQLPFIPGNAFVLTKDGNSNKKYIGYFIENDQWIKKENRLEFISFENVDLTKFSFDEQSRLATQPKKDIEKITRNAQAKRGRTSINMRYYALKRKRKQLERELENKGTETSDSTNEEASNENRSNLFSRATNVIGNLAQRIFSGSGDNRSFGNVYQILSQLIECNLEIGLIDEAKYYINILKDLNADDLHEKLSEYELREDLITQLRKIIDYEMALLSSPEDDVEFFLVKKPDNLSDYQRDKENWEKNQRVTTNRSVLFLYNPQEGENHWDSLFRIEDKICQHKINEQSILNRFLERIFVNKTTHLFHSELLDLLAEKANGEVLLRSKTKKIFDFCFSLRAAYESLGHYPLENHYRQICSYFSEHNEIFRKTLSSSNDFNSSVKHQNQFPLSLFPISTPRSIKKLNDTITEKEFFTHILPNIDRIPCLKRSLTVGTQVDLRFCSDVNRLKEILGTCQKENEKFKSKNPYERKFFLILVECDFYFLPEFDEKNPPKMNSNAIVLANTSKRYHYKSYFFRNSRWTKDVGGLKYCEIGNISLEESPTNKKTELIDKEKFQNEISRNEIEEMAGKMKLNRWYFYGEIAFGRVLEGYIDQQDRLQSLNVYLRDILPRDFRISETEKMQKKVNQISNKLFEILYEDIQETSSNAFLPTISNIEIYDLQKLDQGKKLKKQIKYFPDKNFVCIVKLSSRCYLTLVVQTRRLDVEKKNDIRTIYVLNSTSEKSRLRKLNWLTGVIDQCIYKCDFIQCPKQKLMSEDSFLHAYFNASACQWASENNHWEYLRRSFLKQEFSTKQNIEKIKQWFIDSAEQNSVFHHIENQLPSSENLQLIEKFEKIFVEIIEPKLNSRESVENLTKTFVNITTFDQLFKCIKNINPKNENLDQIKKYLDAIERASDSFDVDTIVDRMFSIAKEKSLNSFEFQEKFSRNLEMFEDEFHHATFSTMISNKTTSFNQQKCFDHAKQLKHFFKSEKTYLELIEFLTNFLEIEKNFPNREKLLRLSKNIQKIIEENQNNKTLVHQMTENSFMIISKFTQYFSTVVNSLREFDEIFRHLLIYSYELIDLSEINSRLKNEIYQYIFYEKQNFESIETCIDQLFRSVNSNQSIKPDFNERIKDMFQSFNQSVANKDERAVHYIEVRLRETMMNTIDHYMKSLAEFRHQSVVSMENFEKSIHRYFIDSIRKSIKTGTMSDKLATEALKCFHSTTLDYDQQMNIYKKIVQIFAQRKDSIQKEVIDSVESQLEDTNHSHFVYLGKKIDDLKKMLSRFAKLEEVLPNFSRLFQKCLNEKYNHLPEQEVFSENGLMKREILDPLKQNKTFNDIKTVVQGFQNTDLNNILKQCEQFIKDQDEKGSAEISECLRQTIIDTTENYTTSLLTFHHRALIVFNQFEKNFHEFLSTYQVLRDKELRKFIEQRLDELQTLPNESDETYYQNALSIYRKLLGNPAIGNTQIMKDIFKETNHSLRTVLKTKIDTLRSMLKNYIDWYEIENSKEEDYEIFQIKTNSAILSKILEKLIEKHRDCFRPNNEIRILNSNKLYIDVDLNMGNYSGVNIVLVSPYQELVKDKDRFVIKTDGKDADDSWKDKPAKNGDGVDNNGKGKKGEDGSNGKPGKSAGHIYVVANELPSMKASACGGKGGNGQNGGNGGNGLDGADGKDADKEAMIARFRKCNKRGVSFRFRRIGTDGQEGSFGGDAGSGGFRGDGGLPGLVKLVSLNDVSKSISYRDSEGYKGDEDGRSGKAGEAGKHGRDGLDYVIITHKTLNPGKFLFQKREANEIKAGRLFPSDRRDAEEEQWWENHVMLPMQYSDEHPRFASKYTVINTQTGASATTKHNNQEAVQKIHAINYEHVFEETSHFFSQFTNPQKSSTYQHWLAPQLNQFLEKMARLEGLPPCEIHVLPDIEYDAKQILILKEKFAEIISIENQRLSNERINTDQLSIGVTSIAQDILNQYNDVVQLYQLVYQQLQDEIGRVDVNQLSTGLEIRSVEFAKMRSTINRMIDEQRFNQRLATLQTRTEVLVDKPSDKVSKSISNRDNIKILQDDVPVKEKWKKFPIENNKIMKEFNQHPNEVSLLEIGGCFYLELEERLSENRIDQINFQEKFSDFTQIYLYNLQQGNYTFENLQFLEIQKHAFFEILPRFQSLKDPNALDFLIDFSKGIEREYTRHFWLIRLKKTLDCLENQRENKENLSNIFNILRTADYNQIEQFDQELQSFSLIKQFSDYDFDEKLYKTNRSKLVESINKFNQDSNRENLLRIFQIFSDSLTIISHKNLLANLEQLYLIDDFLIIFHNNLSLMNIKTNEFQSLTEQIVKIEEILITYPRSHLSDIIFDFSYFVEKLKMTYSGTLKEKQSVLNEIYDSKDMQKLLEFQTDKKYEKKSFTVEQEIDAFNTLYDSNLVEGIFQNLSKASLIPSDQKLLALIRWTTSHFQNFEYEAIGNILRSVEILLNPIGKDDVRKSLRFLKVVFEYKKTKEDRKRQEQSNRLEKEDLCEKILSIVEKTNNFLRSASPKSRKDTSEFYEDLLYLIEAPDVNDFYAVSDEKLLQLENSLTWFLSQIFYKVMPNIVSLYSPSSEELIDDIPKNISNISLYFQKTLDTIGTERQIKRTMKEKSLLSKIFDEIFSDLDKLDDSIHLLFENRLGSSESPQALIEQSKFCLCIYRIKTKIARKILSYFQQNEKLNQSLENQLDKFLKDKSIEEISTPLIEMFNLCVYLPEEKISNFLENILRKEKNRDEKTVCIDLVKSYSTYNEIFKSIEKFQQEISFEDYQVILIFLYHEQFIGKSDYLKEIYRGFFQYCRRCSCLSKSQCNSWIFSMKLIAQADQDSSNPDENNLDHALFQLIFLHSLFKENSLFGEINEENIKFSDWLFDMLSKYQFITNIENIDIKKEHLDKLKNFSSIKDESNQDSKDNIFFKQSMKKIYEEIKLIYIQKSIKIFLKENSNRKWLEVVLYFSDYFHEDSDQILTSIKEQDWKELEKISFRTISKLQRKKLNDLAKFVLNEDLKKVNGYLNGDEKPLEKRSPYDVLNFNHLLDTFNNRFEIDHKLIISETMFSQILQCLSCFEDIRVSIDKLSSSPQTDWLKILLAEHIIEKFIFLFSSDNQIEYLRNQLMKIDDRILFLLNNVFVTQYIDQINKAIYSTQTSIPDYQKITKEKFLNIVQLLENIPGTQQILDQLADASLAVWDTILHEIEFSRIFNIKMRNFQENNLEKILLFFNRIRIQLGVENKSKFFEFFETILQKIDGNTKSLEQLLRSIHYQEISFEEGNKIVSESNYSDWSKRIGEMRASSRKNEKKSDRSAEKIIEQIIQTQNNKINGTPRETLKMIADQAEFFRNEARKREVSLGNENSEIHREIQELYNEKSYQKNPEEYIRLHLDKIVPLILYAWSIANKPQFPKDTQIVAFLLFIHNREKGLLEQVRTGEGKTLIVGITAAFMALCGNAVDIVSSNRDLAIEGEKKCRSFFQLLKIESGHICSDDDQVNRQSYLPNLSTIQGNIVYGEVGAFQRDILEDEFNNQEIFGQRYKTRKKCLIVDEVDNMCLDRARHVLYLSHQIQSLKWIESLFIFIWIAVLRTEIANPKNLSVHKKNIAKFIQQNIDNKNIFLPEYLKGFMKDKIDRWIDSAFQARFMREDDHFVLDISKTDKQRTIIVLDKDTGVEQYSTRWSHGLAQFLELKYRRKISVESLKAVFISNKKFFQRYEHRLYGLTGTLGSENSQSFLSDLYQVNFVDLPTSKEKSYYQLPSRVAIEYNDWLELIAKETIEQVKQRPVLIICENVEATENIWNELIRQNVSPHTIEKYRRDGDNVEERFIKKPASRGDIIIATNKGGRGTDIHVDEQVNMDGGMHVILTYLPENIRVEEQAFGRTARDGAQGTGHFIIQIEKSIFDEIDEINQIPANKRKEKLEDLSEVIVEREKIKRDNKEAARLSQLKQKNILHLEVEEELFERFNRFKSDISKCVFHPLFEQREEKSRKEFVNAFENILKNRWAFWLDHAKEDIEKIETCQGKSDLLQKFDSHFREILNKLLQKPTFENLLEDFLSQPEEAIQIGKVCLSKNEFSMAKSCFEKGIAKGDISGFCHTALAFCLIQMNEDKEVKKRSRRELKKAIHSLESMKRNFMSNLQMAEYLPQLTTDEISKKVSSKENFYRDQIRGKLEVIGLHLHYLKKAVGDTLEPFQLIFHPKGEENLTIEDHERGKELYRILVKKKIIQGDQLRKRFQNKERHKMEKMIREDLDPSIADSLILLLEDKSEFETKDFEKVACSNEELWQMLNFKNVQNVFILDTEKLNKELPDKYEKLWKVLEKQIDSENVDRTLFEDSEEKKALRSFFEEKNILSQTNRVPIELVFLLDVKRIHEELPAEYEELWKDLEKQIDPENVDRTLFDASEEKKALRSFFEEKQILYPNKRGKIGEVDFETLIFDEKYSKIKFNDNGHETKDLRDFLIELKESLIIEEKKYLYQTYIPFTTKEEEANKIRIYLKEKNILKSGGLDIHKHEDITKTIETLLDEALKDTQFENDKEVILGKILALQGDIRSSKEDLKANLKDFIDLHDQVIVPKELKFFEGFGLDKFLIIEEDKSWWDWRAFAVAMIGLGQIIGGAVLISFGLVNIGGALISEGISDMVYATMAGLSGNFSWKDWAIQKAISLSISIMTVGIGSFTSAGSTAAKIGSVSRTAMFAKVVVRAAGQFAVTCLTNVLTEKVMELVQEGLIQKVVKEIEENFLIGLIQSIKKKVEMLLAQSAENFEQSFREMKEHIEGALKGEILISQQFDNIRMQLVSTLTNSYGLVADALKKSNSKYAKIAAHAIKTTIIVNKIWTVVQPILQFRHCYQALCDIIEGARKTEKNHTTEKNLNQNLINDRAEQLNRIIREFISSKLTRELERVLRQIISGTLTEIAHAAIQGIEAMIDSEFNGKNPIDTLRQSNTQNHEDDQIVVDQPSTDPNSNQEEKNQEKREDLQNNIKNPKDMVDDTLKVAKDENRALDRADVKMLVDSQRRNIIIYNKDTGETEVIRPSGIRQIPAFFKQSAKIYYQADENGDIGHYFTARGTETYKQVNGRNDCLLIAFHESLGRKVEEKMIRQEREKLSQYTVRNLDRYVKYRDNLDRSGHPQIIGGKQAPNENNKLISSKKPEYQDPKTIRYSQSTVCKPEKIDGIYASFKSIGWNEKEGPIDVVKMADGKLTSVDNRRLLAATEAGIDVWAKIHNHDEQLTEEQKIRFKIPENLPATWGTAIKQRIRGQRDVEWRKKNPSGAVEKPTGWTLKRE